MTLTELAAKHGTDKGVYAPFYDLILAHKRSVYTSIVEIGVGTPEAMSHVPGYEPGASLRVWDEYFPYAAIYGLDNAIPSHQLDLNITVRNCDQSKKQDLLEAAQWFEQADLIVDDGSHRPQDQIQTALTLLPYLREGGIYIIEDVNYHPQQDVLWGLAAFNPTYVHTLVGGKTGSAVIIGK
jgi:hypothetical protein